MQIPSQQSRPEMPKAYLESAPLDDALSGNNESLAAANERYRGSDTNTHAQYITRITNVAKETPAKEMPKYAYSSRDYAAAISSAGSAIMAARQREINLDSVKKTYPPIKQTQPKKPGAISRLLFGQKGVQILNLDKQVTVTRYQSSRAQREADYMNREAMIGRRVIDKKNMLFFCQDQYTWVWHSGGSDPVTMWYHVRPDGVVKQRIGGPTSRVSGSELEHFGYYVQNYYREVNNTVYRQQPDSGEQPGLRWALAA